MRHDGRPGRPFFCLRRAGQCVGARGIAINSSRADFISRLPLDKRDYFRYFAEGGNDELFISRAEKAHVDNHWTFYVNMKAKDEGKSCIDSHKGIAHHLPKEYEDPEDE